MKALGPVKPTAKSTAISKPPAGRSDLRRSSRANKGEGGVAEQMAKVSDAIEKKQPKVKKTVQDMPDTQPVNPMAPAPPKRRGRGPGKVPAPAPNIQHADLQYLVPLGSEPRLPGPHLEFYGEQFGFQRAQDAPAPPTYGKCPESVPPINKRCAYQGHR